MQRTRIHSAAKSCAALMLPYHSLTNGDKVGAEGLGLLEEKLSTMRDMKNVVSDTWLAV